MTTITGVTGTTGTASTDATTSSTDAADSSSTISSDMFLKLLVTQLQNQDPSSPMDTNQMLSQMTSLASMEQLTSLSSTSSSSYALQQQQTAASLVGREVNYTATDGTSQTGLVSSISYSGSTPTLSIGSSSVALSSVTGVATTTAS